MARKTQITVVTERGQASIPARIRHELGLVRGRRLQWEKVGERELRVIALEAGEPLGADAMRGFARRFRPQSRRSADWMKELREGER